METHTSIKSSIVQKAREMFFTNSYSRVPMADLAKQLGMSKKTLYQYFSGKEDLLNAVIKDYLGEIQAEVEEMLRDESLDFPQKVSQLLRTGTRLLVLNSKFISDIKKHAPNSWQLLQDYKVEAAYKRFNTLLEKGVKEGYVRKDVNRPVAVILYASALETIFNPDFTSQVPKELMEELPSNTAAVFDNLVKVIFHGIFANA